MPITALSGVRISWLIVARNALFASVAASASLARLLELADVVVEARTGRRPLPRR